MWGRDDNMILGERILIVCVGIGVKELHQKLPKIALTHCHGDQVLVTKVLRLIATVY